MKNEINYFEIFNDALTEKGFTISNLESENIITKYTFYKFKKYCPSLENAINIANFLEMSLDYILNKTDENKFKKYKTNQSDFIVKLENILSSIILSKRKFCLDLGLSDANFTKWKNGAIPKFSTIINISNYLQCPLDDLLSRES